MHSDRRCDGIAPGLRRPNPARGADGVRLVARRAIDWRLRDPWFTTYAQMFAMPRWHADLRNVLVFTILFLSGSIGFGLLLALFLDRRLLGYTIFRNIFLFPLCPFLYCYRNSLEMDF